MTLNPPADLSLYDLRRSITAARNGAVDPLRQLYSNQLTILREIDGAADETRKISTPRRPGKARPFHRIERLRTAFE